MKTLKELVGMSETADHALTLLALRPRHRNEPLRISRFKASLRKWGSNPNTKDLVDLLEALEKLGQGRIIYGRYKHPVRFAFSRPVYEIGREALGDRVTVSRPQVIKQIPETKVTAPKVVEWREVVIVMPNKHTVIVKLDSETSLQDFLAALS